MFVTNRSPDQGLDFAVNAGDLALTGLEAAEILAGSDPKAANSYEQPQAVSPKAYGEFTFRNGRASCRLPPLAFLAATLRVG